MHAFENALYLLKYKKIHLDLAFMVYIDLYYSIQDFYMCQTLGVALELKRVVEINLR